MKLIFSFTVAVSVALGVPAAIAASPEQEQAFLDTYKTAFEAQDASTLHGLLFEQGAIPEAVELYDMMMSAEFGEKISSIQLVDFDAEDLARIEETMPMPDGTMARLAPKPFKKLVITIQMSDANGSGTSTSSTYVAEQDGRIGIAMPVPAN
jgi:hypothetical protein